MSDRLRPEILEDIRKKKRAYPHEVTAMVDEILALRSPIEVLVDVTQEIVTAQGTTTTTKTPTPPQTIALTPSGQRYIAAGPLWLPPLPPKSSLLTYPGVRDHAQCKDAAAYIDTGMTWSKTVEGDDFWRAIHQRLREYGT